MTAVISKPGSERKLEILSADAQYDLACACSASTDEHRRRGHDGRWIYPVTLPNGGRSILFKTLISIVCTSDCKYCPLRSEIDLRRCTLSPAETANIFLDYYNRKKVFGLFLSSGITASADAAMDSLNTTAKLLRKKHRFRGYIHLKILPGSSAAAIEEALSLASTVSLNIETPGKTNMETLSNKKRYIEDIIGPIKLISKLTAKGNKFERVKQTTQFIVGAAKETDSEIVKYMFGLYDRLRMHRVYFSAYQKGLGEQSLPAEQDGPQSPADVFMREHRLYQVDFLVRKYGFRENDIVFDSDANLSLTTDPKELWAKSHPEMFPVNINTASKFTLLKVPGLGPVTVNQILKRRRQHRFSRIEDIAKPGVRLRKAEEYLVF